jgi:hypothetical protein
MKTIDNAVLAGYNAGIERRGGRSVSLTIRTENARCRRAAREMDENMLYWYCGARSRDGLPPRVRL